ncbi:hypothetical protein J5N97_009130 [Dioscorea zingiberensis]|uniref:Cysteine proteinase inhibitor n=1 Tax=Dioscorea zingiberensis TaxID=325984 RepID=A0A9D5CYV9_9LILI|nr:hypothetical protein J5N97_009130 [Dioscorea zingiberensis]
MAAPPALGGIRDLPDNENSAEIDELARFAVEEHNKKQNTLLEFGKVLKARVQVVAGNMSFSTLSPLETPPPEQAGDQMLLHVWCSSMYEVNKSMEIASHLNLDIMLFIVMYAESNQIAK